MRVSDSILIRRPAESVFAFLADPSNEPRWHTAVAAARALDGRTGSGSRFEWTFEFRGTRHLEFKVLEFAPPRRQVFAAVASDFPFGYKYLPTFTYEFEDVDGGTQFTRGAHIRIGGLMRLQEPGMKRRAPEQAAAFLGNLKRILEGEAV